MKQNSGLFLILFVTGCGCQAVLTPQEGIEGSPLLKLNSKKVVDRRRAAFHLCSRTKFTKQELAVVKSTFEKDKDKHVRTWCALIIARQSGYNKRFFEFFVHLLTEKDEWFVIQGASGLQYFDDKASNAIPQLIQAHKRCGHAAKNAIVLTFSSIGSNAKAATPLLIQNVRDKRFPDLQAYSAEALGRIGPDANQSVDVLTKLLDDRSFHNYKTAAIIGLGGIGPSAKKAIPSLVLCLKDKRIFIVIKALEALVQIAPTDPIVLASISNLTTHSSSRIRYHAASAFGKINAKPEIAVPPLIRLSKDSEEEVAIKSIRVLASYQSDVAVSAIRCAAKSPNEKVKRIATQLLTKRH